MRHFQRHKQQRGAALIIGLILLAIITLLAVVGMNISNAELASATSEQLRMRAFQAAESGIEIGLADIFTVGTVEAATKTVGPTAVPGSSVNTASGAAVDTFENTSTYRGESALIDGYGNGFVSFHYDVASIGRSARSAISEHTQGTYIVNSSGGQQTYAPLP
jgi:type II secretory pathway component PulK